MTAVRCIFRLGRGPRTRLVQAAVGPLASNPVCRVRAPGFGIESVRRIRRGELSTTTVFSIFFDNNRFFQCRNIDFSVEHTI